MTLEVQRILGRWRPSALSRVPACAYAEAGSMSRLHRLTQTLSL
jgi:hypothetical protein